MAPRPSPPRGAARAIFGFALVAGCATPLAEAPAADAPSVPAPASDPDDPGAAAAPAPLGRAEAVAEAKRILAEVAQSRELSVTRDVRVDVVDRPGIRKFARASMYEYTTPEEIKLIGRIEASLGVIPVGSDAESILLDLLEQGVLGFYDPKEKTLFIGDFVPKPMLSRVVGHEIAHGLQDLHFDLDELQKPLRHNSDGESARRFLVEGGAEAAYLAWISKEEGLAAIDDEVLDAMGNLVLQASAPEVPYPILARSLQMPYTDGTATVVRLVREKGWKAVDALYDHLPETSEQMLHLDKLRTREKPVSVKVRSAAIGRALPGLSEVWNDNLGEAALLSMLADVEPPAAARRAAAGWGGDHYVAFDRTDAPMSAPVVVGVIAWDSKRDAVEFEKAFRRYLTGKVGPDAIVERRGDKVMYATRVPSSVDQGVLRRAAWETKVGRRRAAK